MVAGDLGRPVVMLDVDSPAKQALLELADRVVAAAENSRTAAQLDNLSLQLREAVSVFKL